MPTFRDLYPQHGAVGERFIVKHLRELYLDDCLMILSKLSQHYYKYCQQSPAGVDGRLTYKERCYELLNHQTVELLRNAENGNEKEYAIVFPELSILHLIKLCLKNCDPSKYTKGENFPSETLFTIGKCLLVTNSVLVDAQLKGVSKDELLGEIVVNFTKQVIVDHNFNVFQKFYQTYFVFQFILQKHYTELNLEEVFNECYGISVKEYLAFSFAVLSQFVIKNTDTEDWEHPHLDDTALKNMHPKFTQRLLEDLLINNSNYKKIDLSFFNAFDITKRPLVRLGNGKIVVLSLKRLFIRLTDSVYFDILDSLSNESDKSFFSKIFGKAIEDYFEDIIENIDPNVIKPFKYDREQKETPDAISVIKEESIFFECKKKQFHTLEFLKSGNLPMFFERINEFYYMPLNQICKRVADFRNNEFPIKDLKSDAKIYPVIVCPLAPPIFSGGWDKMDLNDKVLPEAYKSDTSIASPEFIDLTELECVEEYLRLNPEKTFIDLIQIKRSDEEYHNANWMFILWKNGMNLKNTRLLDKYGSETETFGEIVFGSEAVSN